jgi:beta-galactosidase GanA
VLGRWKITAMYGLWQFGQRERAGTATSTNELPVVGAALIQLGPDEFLVAGSDIRLGFSLNHSESGENSQFLDVEEGTIENGSWVMRRRWNGDQVDYGINLAAPTLLRIRLGTYR